MDVASGETETSASAGARIAKTVSVVIPALNEERNIGWVLGRLPNCVDEVIVVDGRSIDRTIEVAVATRPDTRIVEEKTPGKGMALRAGLTQARGDHVVMLDADGSMEPREIGRYLTRLEEGFDVVKGSRFLPGGGTTDISRLRALGNFGLLTLANLMYGCQFTELCYGYMAFKRSVIPLLRLTAAGFEIETQIVTHALRAGLRVAEVPSFEAARRSGESNLRTFRDGTRVLHELLRARLGAWPSPLTGNTPASRQPDPGHAALAPPAPLAQLPARAAGATASLAAAELSASSSTQP
jgi:hypothetical protein